MSSESKHIYGPKLFWDIYSTPENAENIVTCDELHPFLIAGSTKV